MLTWATVTHLAHVPKLFAKKTILVYGVVHYDKTINRRVTSKV